MRRLFTAAISVLRSARGSFRSSFVQAASAEFCCRFRSHLAHTCASLTTSLMHVPYPRVAHTRTLPRRRSYTYLTHASFIHKHVSHPHVAQKCTSPPPSPGILVPRPHVVHTCSRRSHMHVVQMSLTQGLAHTCTVLVIVHQS